MSQDPIGFSGGLNLYGYTNNNPINWVDPEGLAIPPVLLGGWIAANFGPFIVSVGTREAARQAVRFSIANLVPAEAWAAMAFGAGGLAYGGYCATRNVSQVRLQMPGANALGPPAQNYLIYGFTGSGNIQLSRTRFGHTFERHGENATDFCLTRAREGNMPNGQWLDNQKAAEFILNNAPLLTNSRPEINVRLPHNLPARVVNPDGSFSNPSQVTLVRGRRANTVRTSFPVE